MKLVSHFEIGAFRRFLEFVLPRLIIAVFPFVTASANEEPFKSEIIDKIRVATVDKAQLMSVLSSGFDIVEYDGLDLTLLAGLADKSRLNDMGVPFSVEIKDISKFYADRYAAELAELTKSGSLAGAPSATMGGFETYSEITTHIHQAWADHSSIVADPFSIGTTIDGNQQWVVKISDNPTVDEDEPEIFLVSLLHAREPCGAASHLNVMDYLTDNYGTDSLATYLVDNREIFILPVANPDGYVYNELINPTGGGMWRKNRRNNGGGVFGVDLNRNYSAHWGYDNIGSSPFTNSNTYRGPAPFSEPETSNIRDFVLSRNFSIIHNNHSYSDLVLWPFGYTYVYTPEQDIFQAIGDSMATFHGYFATIGWNLYPTNGEADEWAYDTTGGKTSILSFTSELGSLSDGFWASLSRIPVIVDENLAPNLYLISIADNPRRAGPPIPPVLTGPDSSSSGDFILSWTDSDTNNPAVDFHLAELTDYERVIDSAEADLGYWEVENFALSTLRSHSGASSWKNVNSNRSHCWLVSETPVIVKPGDSLVSWLWYEIETDWDYFYVQVSTDGGFLFDNLAHPTITTNSDPNSQNGGNGVTGNSGGWIEAGFDLSSYVGEQIYVRLAYYTDAGVLNEGVYIDDIALVDVYGTQTVISPVSVSPYEVLGKTDGEYCYTVSAEDAEGQIGRPSRITCVSVTLASTFLCGDADGDEEITIADAIFIVKYVFGGGEAPIPVEAGDADGGGDVNIGDAIWLVKYVFADGANPVCP
ncbi:MAG: immune inhibitor A [candidate division Zixibacteria bacterium]|nr:immune inhibitor A [candidate division Zixibacteria bacterium]